MAFSYMSVPEGQRFQVIGSMGECEEIVALETNRDAKKVIPSTEKHTERVALHPGMKMRVNK